MPCAEGAGDEADLGRTYQTIANVSLGLALVGTVAGVSLWVLRWSRTDDVAVQIGPSGLSLAGRF